MKTTGFFNIKGGVGKTTSSINFACNLASNAKRVLLIDLDMQGNSSRFFGVYDKDRASVADVLAGRTKIKNAIRKTAITNVDVLPANMSLINTEREILLDMLSPQQTRLKTALAEVEADYDHCVIDCPTYLTIALINGLVAMDDVIVPTSIDEQAFEGLTYVLQTISNTKPLNPKLNFAGCLVTMYRPSLEFNREGMEYLTKLLKGKVFENHIRWGDKVSESIAARSELSVYSPRCNAGKNYRDFCKEYLGGNK